MKKRNPRYLVTRDGIEVAIYPAFNGVEAITKARKQYGTGRYKTTKIDEQLYLGRGAKQSEQRERLERRKQTAARKRVTKNPRLRNAAERDVEHPIEVTRHYRSGPPGYLSQWQRAAAMGQDELFPTGIQLSARAAELRASRVRNPGVNQRVYQSGLKEATAAQLGRLARIGLRIGRTATEIAADLRRTGRFTAPQIKRGVTQATIAEQRKKNPRNTQSVNDKKVFEQLLATEPEKVAELFALIKESYKGYGDTEATNAAKDWFRDYFRRVLLHQEQYFVQLLDYYIEAWKKGAEQRKQQHNPQSKTVRRLYEKFSGRKSRKQTELPAPDGTPAQVAKLGRLRLIRTTDGRQWAFRGKQAPYLAADARGKLHVVGGQYRANPVSTLAGEIDRIEYEASKPHLGQPQRSIYYHQLGEETGKRPMLHIDRDGLLKIRGGAYRIEADGIHN